MTVFSNGYNIKLTFKITVKTVKLELPTRLRISTNGTSIDIYAAEASLPQTKVHLPYLPHPDSILGNKPCHMLSRFCSSQVDCRICKQYSTVTMWFSNNSTPTFFFSFRVGLKYTEAFSFVLFRKVPRHVYCKTAKGISSWKYEKS